MPGAVIAIDQDRPGGTSFGSPGVARKDLWRNHVVRPRCATTGNSSILWSLEDIPPGSSASITPGTETETVCDFNPDTLDTISLKLTTNGGGPGNVQILSCAVTYDEDGNLVSHGWRIPALGEQASQSNFDGQNRGWDEALRKFINDIRNGAIPGGGGIDELDGNVTGDPEDNRVEAIDGDDDGDVSIGAEALHWLQPLLFDGAILARTRIVTTSTATLNARDLLVLVQRSAGSTLTLPPPGLGRLIIIADAQGMNLEGAISLAHNGTERINGDNESPYAMTRARGWIIVTSDGTNWFAAQWAPTAAGGGGANIYSYVLQSGAVSTSIANSASKLALGAVQFDPSVVTPTPPATLHVRFEAILETSNASRPAFVDLYDVAGATTIASSQLSSNAFAATYVSVDLPDLVGVDPLLIQARLWMDPQDPGDVVTCSYAALVLTVS